MLAAVLLAQCALSRSGVTDHTRPVKRLARSVARYILPLVGRLLELKPDLLGVVRPGRWITAPSDDNLCGQDSSRRSPGRPSKSPLTPTKAEDVQERSVE